MIKRILDDKKGRLARTIIFLILIMLVVLIPIGIHAADNSSISTTSNKSKETVSSQSTDTTDSISSTTDSTNTSQEETQTATTSETIVQENQTQTSSGQQDTSNTTTDSPTSANNTENNQTSIETTETTNETIVEDNQTESTNSSALENATTTNQDNQIPAVQTAEEQGGINGVATLNPLDVKINYPQKITRGESIKLNATITNLDNKKIKNIWLDWNIPSGFEIDSGQQTEIISLDSGESYTTKISLETLPSTQLGINEIKLEVSY